jgi:hypothetical protein
VARKYVTDLIRSKQAGTSDLALRLVQPGRTFLALVSAVLALVAALWPGDYLLSWPLWVALALIQFLVPLPFLMRDGVESRYLKRYPLLTIIGLLYLPSRLLRRSGRGGYHTPHGGD